MPSDAMLFESIAEVADRFQRRDLSPVELTTLTLERIERLNPRLGAYINHGDDCLNQAREAERRFQRKAWLGALDGIPISVKDLIDVRGFPTTAGSRVFGDGKIPQSDATAVSRLRRAGAIVVGKTSLHEFAYGVTNENSHFGAAVNPWDSSRTSGGSSGGSGVAVAAGMCFGSLGTDTRGSIRIPSAGCGITGLKPTLGRIPTAGVVPLSWTLDHVGPMARSVRDVAQLYGALAPSRVKRLPAQALGKNVEGLKVGICDYYLNRVDSGTAAAVAASVRLLESAGLKFRRVIIGRLDEALWASGMIASTEALVFHSPFMETNSADYDPAVLTRLRKGRSISGVDLARAFQIRLQVAEEFRRAFRECDCLIAPTIPAPPPRLGEDFLEIGASRVPVVENLVRLCAPQNVAGIPALSLPCGFDPNGLPIGLQIISGRNRENTVLELGAYFQSITDWHLRRPPLAPTPDPSRGPAG